jgi:hypothetical protein
VQHRKDSSINFFGLKCPKKRSSSVLPRSGSTTAGLVSQAVSDRYPVKAHEAELMFWPRSAQPSIPAGVFQRDFKRDQLNVNRKR